MARKMNKKTEFHAPAATIAHSPDEEQKKKYAFTITYIPTAKLHKAEWNYKTDDAEKAKKLAANIQRNGILQASVVYHDKDRIVVLDGNHRLDAYNMLGIKDVPCADMGPIPIFAAKRLAVELNETKFDNDPLKLAGILQEISLEFSAEELALTLPFDTDELNAYKEIIDLANLELKYENTDADDCPEPPDKAVTQPGDIWILGNHRLMCGDSGKPEDVDRLLDGAKIQLVNTDPPYNVKVEPRSNNAIAAGLSSFAGYGNTDPGRDVVRHPEKANKTHAKMRAKDRPLENDFMTDDEFTKLLHGWFGTIQRVLDPGRAFYIWGGYSNIANYPPVLAECELYFSQMIIWVKEHPVLTRKDFMGNHEWCFYGWREGKAHVFLGPNNATDVWSVKKISPQQMEHLTQKPVELAERAMLYSSHAGENVLDLFGGSGSTLIGAEKTGRKAFVMELDPPYCDVIVDRFQRFTGTPAVLERTGESPIPMKTREEKMR